jgi:hypothetical protein
MKTGRMLMLSASLACAVGCTPARYTILAVPAVSMTTPSMPAGSTATPAGRVESEFCRGDEPVVSKDANVGLIDEAVAKAQQKSGAQYLSDVTIQQGGSCVYVEGMAMK